MSMNLEGAWFGSPGAKLNEAQIALYKPSPKMATGLGSKVTHKGFSSLSSDHDWVINPAKKEQISIGLWGPVQDPAVQSSSCLK